MVVMSLPHRVDVRCWDLGEDRKYRMFEMARWCYANLAAGDWIHDMDGFEFGSTDDMAWFIMVWAG